MKTLISNRLAGVLVTAAILFSGSAVLAATMPAANANHSMQGKTSMAGTFATSARLSAAPVYYSTPSASSAMVYANAVRFNQAGPAAATSSMNRSSVLSAGAGAKSFAAGSFATNSTASMAAKRAPIVTKITPIVANKNSSSLLKRPVNNANRTISALTNNSSATAISSTHKPGRNPNNGSLVSTGQQLEQRTINLDAARGAFLVAGQLVQGGKVTTQRFKIEGQKNPPKLGEEPSDWPDDSGGGTIGSTNETYNEFFRIERTMPSSKNENGFWVPWYIDSNSGEWVWLWVGPSGKGGKK
jgi:hypothetical protein